jgi:glycosyltransferase involved in cell wall biosynthesis
VLVLATTSGPLAATYCEATAPLVGEADETTLAQVYALTAPIRWRQVSPTVAGLRTGESWWVGLRALREAKAWRPDLAYARHYIAPWLTARAGIVTAAETHVAAGTRTRAFRRLVAATRLPAFATLITISRRLAEDYASAGMPRKKLLVLPDAVDLPQFVRPAVLPPSPYAGAGPHVAYVGHLYDYKGIPAILDAAAHLPEAQFHLVGGWPEDVERQRRRAADLRLANVTFHGLRPQSEVPAFLWHANVLLLPPSARHPSAAWTSPVKLGEYLASETPVVATDIPALRDWLTDQQVRFVAPDDGSALAAGIRDVLTNPAQASAWRQAGRQLAESLSYERRAQQLIDHAMAHRAADQ